MSDLIKRLRKEAGKIAANYRVQSDDKFHIKDRTRFLTWEAADELDRLTDELAIAKERIKVDDTEYALLTAELKASEEYRELVSRYVMVFENPHADELLHDMVAKFVTDLTILDLNRNSATQDDPEAEPTTNELPVSTDSGSSDSATVQGTTGEQE